MADEKTILLVEDDARLSEINRRALERAGYRVHAALTLAQARRLFAQAAPDAIVLDIRLPDGNGVDFLREIRERTGAPILLLTAVSGYQETLDGLAAGGDDYLNKPCDLNLLVAKLHAFLRRDAIARRVRPPAAFTHGPLTIEDASGRALLYGQDMLLTQKEVGVLRLLARSAGDVVPKRVLFETVWGQQMTDDTSAIKTVISRLRRKLEGHGFEIEAVRGEGYRLACAPDKADANER